MKKLLSILILNILMVSFSSKVMALEKWMAANIRIYTFKDFNSEVIKTEDRPSHILIESDYDHFTVYLKEGPKNFNIKSRTERPTNDGSKIIDFLSVDNSEQSPVKLSLILHPDVTWKLLILYPTYLIEFDMDKIKQ